MHGNEDTHRQAEANTVQKTPIQRIEFHLSHCAELREGTSEDRKRRGWRDVQSRVRERTKRMRGRKAEKQSAGSRQEQGKRQDGVKATAETNHMMRTCGRTMETCESGAETDTKSQKRETDRGKSLGR